VGPNLPHLDPENEDEDGGSLWAAPRFEVGTGGAGKLSLKFDTDIQSEMTFRY
jgi:hypothetical protein